MMMIVGLFIVIATVYFLIKQYDARFVLLASGIIMACIGGVPMSSLDSFAKNMTNGGLIQAVCSVMGFAMVMKITQCDKHLINFMAKALSRFRPFLIPGVVLATYAVNVALPSAAGTAAAAGAIFVPLMMSAGVHPAMAAAAVKCGTYGSMLNPGLAHNPFVAKIAGVSVMDVISFHYKANIASLLTAAVVITLTAYYLKEHKGYQSTRFEADESFKVNYLYALMPILPIAILIVCSTLFVDKVKMDVPQAMLIGAAVSLFVTRTHPVNLSNAFFEGMGKAYGSIIGIIISAGVFVSGLTAMGLVNNFMDIMLNNPAIVKICAAVGPFVLGVIMGSGDAATFAFNEAITPHAQDFGLSQVQMGSMATLGGTLGRTMSPIAGATIIVAGIAGVNPMEIAKRNCLPMVLAMVVGMFFLLN
ncbi:C4-dicarboxylate transporter, DcuC family [Propionispira arboris]|uniref:C4-dicarboxylate transporter, DcuC family n=2 Tax=Propionispira arboris TaxID=84035 RepID=A0A1H7A5G2_9FIRM|nr:C4-dicarboxylate transporter, DcuC family [Propionispira arboris]